MFFLFLRGFFLLFCWNSLLGSDLYFFGLLDLLWFFYFFLGLFLSKTLRIFSEIIPKLFVAVLKLFGEGVVDGLGRVEGIAVGDDEADISVELF